MHLTLIDLTGPIAGNFNGGLYVVTGSLLPNLSETWDRWARWLLDEGVLGRYSSHFADQVAMAMALAKEKIASANLGREWNFPTHIAEWIRADAGAPSVVHYHGRVDATGLISATGSAEVDGVVADLNEAISDVWHEALPISAL